MTVAVTWSEDLTSKALHERSGGRCERCWKGDATDKAHRVREGQGGLMAPHNMAHLCRFCHGWAHHNPTLAKGCGLEVHPSQDPHTRPVYLNHEGWRGWWLLTYLDDGASQLKSHVLVPVDPADYGLPDRPDGAA